MLDTMSDRDLVVTHCAGRDHPEVMTAPALHKKARVYCLGGPDRSPCPVLHACRRLVADDPNMRFIPGTMAGMNLVERNPVCLGCGEPRITAPVGSPARQQQVYRAPMYPYCPDCEPKEGAA